ncbi:hypothetical protein [Schaalia hyovaginalis]|uniref:hypothetical protein n=1 Tax=Schaalia hyovaginalis TaxID=29316 RepID=UPI0012B38646|nr:hypothetical protein [Schaalia hyovaginalis]MST63959.1 hypothetical protein [Schaalia hyovaginalis]
MYNTREKPITLLMIPVMSVVLILLLTMPWKTRVEGMWTTLAYGEIVQLKDGSGVFVSGTRWHINSRNVLDYQYAYVDSNGNIKQNFVSHLWDRHSADLYVGYGEESVTIYEDVTEPGAQAYIEVVQCQPPAKNTEDPTLNDGLFHKYSCAGARIGEVFINIHIPPNTYIDESGLTAPIDTEQSPGQDPTHS